MDPQIQELIDRMRELVNTMRETSKTGAVNNDKARSDTDPLAKSFTRNVDRLITSLGILSVKLDGTSRTRAEEEHAAKRFTANVNRATKAQDQQNAAIEENIKAQRRAAMTADELAAEQKKIAQDAATIQRAAAATAAKTASDNAKTAQREKDDATRDAAYKAQGILSGNKLMAGLTALAGASVAAQLAVSSFGGILSGARGVGTAMAGLGSSLANGNTAFTSLNGVVGALGSALGKIPLIGGGFEAAAKGTSFLITQIENVITDFKDLSKVGALTAKGMTGVREQFLASGQTMAGFKKNVIDFAPALAQFKGDVGAGANEFAKISGELLSSDLGKELKLLTGDVDLIGEGIADYVKLQTQLGLAQKKDYKQLAQGAGEYAKEMDLLTRQTGLSRKDLQSARDAAQNESRYRAAIETMRAGSEEDNKKADILDSVQLIVGATNKEFSQAIRDAAGGFNNTEAVKKFIRAGIDFDLVVGDIKSGVINTSQEAVNRLKEMSVSAEEFVKNQALIGQNTGSSLPEYAPLLKFIRSSTKEAGAQVAASQKDLAKGTDEFTNNVVTAQAALLESSRNITNFGFALMPTATTAIRNFADVLNDTVKQIAKATGINLPTIGEASAAQNAEDNRTVNRKLPPTPEMAKQATDVETAKKVAGPLIADRTAARKSHDEAKEELALFEKSKVSQDIITASKKKVAELAEKRAAAEDAADKAERIVRDKTADLSGKAASQKEEYNKWLYKNVYESRKIGDVIVSDEKSKQSYVFDEAKLFKADRDNYERFVKRKDELTNAELKSFKDRSGTEATGDVKKAIETRGREQARREFAPAVQASGAARSIQYTPMAASTTLGLPNESAPTKPGLYAGADEWAKYRAADKKFTEESKQKRSAPATPQTPAATKDAETKEHEGNLSQYGIGYLKGVVAAGPGSRALVPYEDAKKELARREAVYQKRAQGVDEVAPATPQPPTATAPATAPATPKTADYTPPVPSAATSPRAPGSASAASLTGKSPLAELVARGESAGSGGYNAANYDGGRKRHKEGEKNLTGMTIGDLQKSQASGDIFTAGRYQIVPATMQEAVQQLGLKSTDKFDEAMQDRIFKEYLTGVKRPEIQSFLSGNKTADIDAAVLSLAQEFASVGVPSSMKISDKHGQRELNPGDGYYSGVVGNPTGPASITPEQARAALTQTRDQMKTSVAAPAQKLAMGGVIESTPGGVGVIAGEAGRNEAFVPLPDGKRIPVKQDTTVIKDVQNLSAQVSGLSKLLAGKMITQTGATDNDQGMGIKTSTIITKLLKTAFPVLGQIEKIGGIGNTAAGVADTDSKMSGFDKFLEVAKMLSPQIRVLSGIYDTVKPFLQSDDNTATLAKRQMPVAPDLSAAITDLGNLASTNTPNLGEIASPSIDRADVTSNNIGKLVDELKEQNKSNMKDAMSSVAGELKDAFKGMSPQLQDNSSSQELVAAVNEMVRTQRDTNAISSRILQVSQN